ncbi:MAG: DUF560 domain-containing protein [Candidatus Omnitrophica bacterium]|nr:DUF560 domain-containing protein [Candidatus Omnitrophota bacterium]
MSTATMSRKWFWIFLFVFCSSFIQSHLYAQHEYESEVPEREKAVKRQTDALSDEAIARQNLESDREVTFEDILADPDNIQKNYLYARTEVSKGNLLGAASTLERILMIDPDLAQVRLFYAIVLYRLDNIQESEIELNRLKELKLPPAIQSEVDNYLKQIRLRGKQTRLAIRESFGYQFDSNRNAAPSSKKRLFGNGLLNVDRTNGRHYDSSILNVTNVNLSHDLGFQAGHEVFADFTYFLGEQFKRDDLDLQSFQGEFGGTFKSEWFNFTPTFFFGHTSLSGETFMRTQGGAITLDRKFFKKLDVYAVGRLARQDFVDITENLASHERAGDQMDGTVGVSYELTKTMRLLANYARIDKNAKEEYNAYTGNVFSAGHSWLLGKGQFLLNTIEFARNRYEGPDSALAARVRRDKSLRLRTTYGAPLTTLLIGKILPRPLKDITLTVTYEYYRQLSNYTNYTYRNNKFQAMLSKTFEF